MLEKGSATSPDSEVIRCGTDPLFFEMDFYPIEIEGDFDRSYKVAESSTLIAKVTLSFTI